MSEVSFTVTDCDGHIIESNPELAERPDLTYDEQ